jgi:hypothetical protein
MLSPVKANIPLFPRKRESSSVSFPRKRESSSFSCFLDARFHGHDKNGCAQKKISLICGAAIAVAFFTVFAFAADDPYDVSKWPGANADLVDGVDITSVSLDCASWGNRSYRQPASGTRHTLLKNGKTTAFVTIAVADSIENCHLILANFLRSCTRFIPKAPASLSFGDVAYAGFEGNESNVEKVHLLAFATRNVSVVIQNTGALSADEMKTLAEKIVAAISARPLVKTENDLHKPALAVKVSSEGPPENGTLVVEASDPQNLDLNLSFEPGGAEGNRDGNTIKFTAKKPGTYAIVVTATNTLNLSTTKTFTLVVK